VFWWGLGETLRLALLATALAAGVALLLVATLGEWLRRSMAARVGLRLGLLVPHLAVALAVLLLLGQSGWLALLAYAWGGIQSPQEFPLWVHDAGQVGLLVFYTLKEVPFIALFLLALYLRLNPDYAHTARTLGANSRQVFWRVTLPALLPGLGAASVVVFAFVFGAYEFPLLLGRTLPRTLPVLAYETFIDTDLTRRPEAMALAVAISALTLAVVVVYQRLQRRLQEMG